MYNKELEEIIDAVLADGVLTDKEREVLHKKAAVYGVDPNELDVVVEGRLQKMQHEVDAAKQKVRKCPSCGEIIPAMSAVCPTCGQVIDTSNADNKALEQFMTKLETSLVRLKERGALKYNKKVRAELEGMMRQGRALYGDNKKIAFLIGEVESSISRFDSLRRKYVIGIVTAIVLVVGLICFAVYDSYAADEAAIEHVDAQAAKLREKIKNLPAPNKQNYDQCVAELGKITWEVLPDESRNWDHTSAVKDEIKQLKINYVKLLNSVEQAYIDKLTGKGTSIDSYYKNDECITNAENPKYIDPIDVELENF